MSTYEDYKNVGIKVGCMIMLIIGGCVVGLLVALTIKLIMWMFGL